MQVLTSGRGLAMTLFLVFAGDFLHSLNVEVSDLARLYAQGPLDRRVGFLLEVLNAHVGPVSLEVLGNQAAVTMLGSCLTTKKTSPGNDVLIDG